MITVTRHTRARRLRVVYGRPPEVATYAFPTGAAFRLAIALFVRRYAFRVIRWTQKVEIRAYARAEVI